MTCQEFGEIYLTSEFEVQLLEDAELVDLCKLALGF